MDKDTLKKNLTYTNRFLGYGNPHTASVYFFGIEEYGEFEEDNFYELRKENKRYFIPGKKKSSGRTENTQSVLTYRILRNVLNISMNCTEEEFKKGNFDFENPMFCSNLYPMGSNKESDWADSNIKLTGYENKTSYRKDCLFGAGHFQGIISRKEVLCTFLKFIKRRMESPPKFVFVMGHNKIDKTSPGNVFQELFSSVFNNSKYDCDDSRVEKVTNYRGQPMISQYHNRVWITPHPRNLSYADLDKMIEKIIQTKDLW